MSVLRTLLGVVRSVPIRWAPMPVAVMMVIALTTMAIVAMVREIRLPKHSPTTDTYRR